MLRYLTAGESHGPALTAIVEGLPSNLQLEIEGINQQLWRRQQGYGRGGRMKIETDRVDVLSGVRFGKTMGTPVALQIHNKDWRNWSDKMAIEGEPHESVVEITKPRPGHADLAGALKYHQEDIRNVLERASARNTATMVAVGSIARQLLKRFGIEVFGHVVELGPVKVETFEGTIPEIAERAEHSEVRVADPDAEKKIIDAIDEAKAAGNTLGGIFEVIVTGVPIGLGSYSHPDRKLDGRLAQAVMSIQAIKGVEIGLGFEAARRPGSDVHDEIGFRQGDYYRRTNRAGGLEGGVTNGQPLIVRAAMKPIPTLYKPLESVDMRTKEPYRATIERSDVCAVPAACVVGEAMVAWTVAQAFLEKFGGDSVEEIERNLNQYLQLIGER
ncbi:chorismate synthase [Tumebacillus permanentifrigoris]|uniref:Chorismate synthase n=1 Tax=Tumebacillus permanentifrigoris TaxID=378543 RepID=A0A316D5Q5_9BACL|nr:chorismate synthase [Tumebacillus permanentifrigoris]PWK06617.1 chorismate synthase [Tumebacillus permanentifrigoris]